MPNPNTKGISVHVDRELHAEITAYLQEHNMKMGDFIALAAQDLLRPTSPEIDPDLQNEIKAYLDEHDMTMDEFFAQAAQNELHPQIPGIGTKLQAEINAYLEEHDMTMGEFIALAAQDEMHPKTPETEVKEVGRMRTLAFQVDEELFQRVKQYLERNNMTQKQFVIGLIEEELDRDEELLRKQQEGATPDEEEAAQASADDEPEYAEDLGEDFTELEDGEFPEEDEQGEDLSESGEAPVSADGPDDEYEDEQKEHPDVGDSEGGFDEPGEEESEQESAGNNPEYTEGTGEDFTEHEGVEFPEEDEQGEELSEGSEAPMGGGSPDNEYADKQEEAPAVGDSESGFDIPDDEDPEQSIAEAPPDRGFIEGELGAAVEVAPYPGFGEDDQPAFPEPEEGEDQEYGSMGMSM